ncbi:MAG TPA: hypothetical protein VG895_04935 [Patescibacteria group bacterium]|nr:hypothetical protein [Patescibacteria group bacterium]
MSKDISKVIKLQNEEDKILKEEKEIKKENEELKKLIKKDIAYDKKTKELEVQEVNFIQKFAIKSAKKHKLIFAVLVATAAILVWHSAWTLLDKVPAYFSLTFIIVGIIILWMFNQFKRL